MRWGAVVGALAAVVSLSGASPASAADMSTAPLLKAPNYIPAIFSWTGFYVGLSAGGGWGTANITDPFKADGGSPRLSGFLIGGVTGTNYQIGSLVVGVEGDFTGSWAKGTVFNASGDSLENEVMWTSVLAARLGWSWDRFMLYMKGGGAFDQDRTTAGSVNGGSDVGGVYRAGWAFGAGAEYAVTEHWIVRGAWDYMKWPNKTVILTGSALTAGGLPLTPVGTNVGLSMNQFKAIVEYKF